MNTEKTKKTRKNKLIVKRRAKDEVKNLLIALLLGDGTISNNHVFKLSHSTKQKEYLNWKIGLLNSLSIKNNGIKNYVSKCGYNTGKDVLYTQLSIIPIIKTLRRVVYTPKKTFTRRLLNRLDARGLAIWYMDDGCINIRKTNDKIHGFYIRISTCTSEEQTQLIIDFFKEKWGIEFYKFSEGRGTYSICCGTKMGIKFIDIIKKYVEEIPSMMYKITYDLSQRTREI